MVSAQTAEGLNTIISRALHMFCRSYEGKAVGMMRRREKDLFRWKPRRSSLSIDQKGKLPETVAQAGTRSEIPIFPNKQTTSLFLQPQSTTTL